MKTKLILGMMLGMLLIGLASASLSVSPSTFDIPSHPGDIIGKNVTIHAGYNSTVYLDYMADPNITMNYTSPITFDYIKTVELTFTFSKDIPLGVYPITITASSDQTGGYHHGSSGGSGSSQTLNVSVPIISNSTTNATTNSTTNTNTENQNQDNNIDNSYNQQTGVGLNETTKEQMPVLGFFGRIWAWIKSLFGIQ